MRTDLPVMLMAPAEDLERARRFYELTLGLRLLQATRTEASYECPTGVKLCLYRKPAPEAQPVSLSWEVPNVDRLAQQLKQRGIVVEAVEDSVKEDSSMPREVPARMLRFQDTEGNTVSMFQSQK